LKVAISAMAIGVGLYIIPIGMVIHPEIIALDDLLYALLFSIKIAAGITVSSYGLISRRKLVERLALVIVGLVILFVR
jgi:TRAP-type uncharacterized transport system fused permease subunit